MYCTPVIQRNKFVQLWSKLQYFLWKNQRFYLGLQKYKTNNDIHSKQRKNDKYSISFIQNVISIFYIIL